MVINLPQALVMTALMACAAAAPLSFGLGAPLLSKVSAATCCSNSNCPLSSIPRK